MGDEAAITRAVAELRDQERDTGLVAGKNPVTGTVTRTVTHPPTPHQHVQRNIGQLGDLPGVTGR